MKKYELLGLVENALRKIDNEIVENPIEPADYAELADSIHTLASLYLSISSDYGANLERIN